MKFLAALAFLSTATAVAIADTNADSVVAVGAFDETLAETNVTALEPLPAFTNDGTPIVDLRIGSPTTKLSKRADCQNSGGVANGACVKLYGGANGAACSDNLRTQYKPTCGGNCYVYDSFVQLKVMGDGTYGTNCHVYQDKTCGSEVFSTGNVVVGPGKCFYNLQGNNAWKSMKCFYRC